MSDALRNVRLATAADVDAVVATVAAAFRADPAWSFIVGAENSAARAAFARSLLLPRIRRGTAWIADDGMAVAMWDRRDTAGHLDTDHDDTWERFRNEVGEAVWSRLEAYEEGLKVNAPEPPYWYLGVLATHPDAQGRGMATAVLQPGLAAAEAVGWDCWLETSTPSNKSFYASRGFTDSIAVDIADGPPTWWLRRPAPRQTPPSPRPQRWPA